MQTDSPLLGKGLLTPIQKSFLSAFSHTADQEQFYLTGGTALAEFYFDLYWFAVALNRCQSFPDELERWPVKMLKPVDPVRVKAEFSKLAAEILSGLTSIQS